jgi:hypothetical protein
MLMPDPPTARQCLELAPVAAAPGQRAIAAAVESLQQSKRVCQSPTQCQELADGWLALLQGRWVDPCAHRSGAAPT